VNTGITGISTPIRVLKPPISSASTERSRLERPLIALTRLPVYSAIPQGVGGYVET
jgi:hypothetical protein